MRPNKSLNDIAFYHTTYVFFQRLNDMLTYIFLLYGMSMSIKIYDMSFNFVNNIYMLWAHLLYITLFSSNKYVLVIHVI